MMDVEKVIKEFADFVKSFAKRDDTYYKGLFVSVLDLLKEQEAVKIDVKKINDSGRCGRCPNCLIELNDTDYPNYCGYCGQKVKWWNG